MKKTFIITGGNSGLGYQCAKNMGLQSKEYRIIIASRNYEKSASAVRQLILETGNTNIHTMRLCLPFLWGLAVLQKFQDNYWLNI